ncbi:chromosome segregation protein SMC [Mycetocola tolaasinivorans]|uniref:Chromosome partition protein Smc n=1 Tax=Mycetocola tolaasinivorans TaxID=76635 RepID=A0A3L6ZWD8_9MICO|nr:chromosome segregation protein SMC [Mycetocola tolaasinivorans]RLP71891.1 chromosome segregation protein SMC [Mycetocola tolaasinivorans]
MYLKSLTLKGFKSFAQPTTFAFEPGVTCVVGPNGSGKSNVVDALAWVMGEQGAKTLRGGKMEDVIFAGTSTRGPLGRAEVTLTIDNSDGALPIEYTEVTISRTLFRNGGSEYAINGQSSRLLDVQELLSDSGLGREMHVIVGQGQLDAVLRATPEDRRGFIEEAAGILKHRRRKEKTLRKLDGMQANLTRLSDLAGEIRRQLKPLGKQAEVAREAQSIQAIARDARARLLADDIVRLETDITTFSGNESDRLAERAILQERADHTRARIAQLEQAQIGDAVDRARTVVFDLESVRQRLDALTGLATQKVALLDAQGERPAAAPGISPEAIERAEAEVTRLIESIDTAEAAWERARQTAQTARGSLDAVDTELAAQSELLSAHDLEVQAATGRAETAASRLAALRAESERQERAETAATERAEDAARALAEAETGAGAIDADTSGLNDAYRDQQERVQTTEAETERLRDLLHAAERERDALAAQTTALARALDIRDGAAELLARDLTGVTGLVAAAIRVDAGYEAAITAALGRFADGVVVTDADAAHGALDRVENDALGRVDLVIADAATPATSPAAGLIPADTLVSAPDGVRGLLAGVYVAEDRGAARRGLATLPEGVPATIVTVSGDVLTRFSISGGSGEGRGRIALRAEHDTAADRLAEVHSGIETLRVDLTAARAEGQAAKQASAAALTALRELDASVAAESERLHRARGQHEAAQAERERLRAARAASATGLREAEAAASAADRAVETVRAKPRPILDASLREGLWNELETAREAEVEARLRVETARERVRTEQDRLAALRRRFRAERDAAEAEARRAVLRARQLEVARSVLADLPAVREVLERSLAQAALDLAHAEHQRGEQNRELQELRAEESGARTRLDAIADSMRGLEMQIYERRVQLTSLLERALSELGLEREALVVEYGPDTGVRLTASEEEELTRTGRISWMRGAASVGDAHAGDPAPAGAAERTLPYARAEQERRHQSAQRKLGQLGRVNPLALEEFAALEQRHAFLTEQLADLTRTRADLMTIIEELDAKMQTIFGEAFADTQAQFAEVFPILFPGGTGSIDLTDPDDLLTTGIEVRVRPAGKKIERLSLLSGGERSLAAVALLVAIFRARPSPFYIMDEVEAALDDANLGRLLTIFEGLRESSQLIVITHQKRTMEIADALYGVSMRQDGVSAVVGQRVVDRAAVEV